MRVATRWLHGLGPKGATGAGLFYALAVSAPLGCSWPMPRQTPIDLADEICTNGGQWSLVNARFQPAGTKGARSLGVSIAVSGGDVLSDIALDSRPLRETRQAVQALKRSGYEILSIRSKPFHARRPLRGFRELDAEVRRLEETSRDRSVPHSFPPRVPRRRGLPEGSGPFSMATFERLRRDHGWTLQWVSAARKGPVTFIHAPAWSSGAWCGLFDDGDDRLLVLHVQLFPKKSSEPASGKEFLRLTRAFRERLEPLGYAAVKLRLRGPKRPLFAVFEKSVPGLSGARRERERLDRVLFGN
jgi:hypothetical protein